MKQEQMIETAARREAQALSRDQRERQIPPITAANAATMVSAEIFALVAEDAVQLELALTSLATVARAHAMECFLANGRNLRAF
jgi:hypothetical protein